MGSSPAQQIGVRTASSACRRDGRPQSTSSREITGCPSLFPEPSLGSNPHIGCNRPPQKVPQYFGEPFRPRPHPRSVGPEFIGRMPWCVFFPLQRWAVARSCEIVSRAC